jgi:hypothetical protein
MNKLNKKLEKELIDLHLTVNIHDDNLRNNNNKIIKNYDTLNEENKKLQEEILNLKEAINEVGGLRGLALTLRVALTKSDDGVIVSYTNPQYWGNAYWESDYDTVAELYEQLDEKLSVLGDGTKSTFGSEKGLSEKNLKKYRYMFGMERFSDVVELKEFESFEEAIEVIDGKFKDSENLVYSVELKDKKLKLYGIAIGGEKGEDHFLPIIDITTPKHTAFLPYELFVVDNKAVMLHGRYRIALSFPDLTMGTFSKIMSTPGDIKKALKTCTE